jgi:hypothetical protein
MISWSYPPLLPFYALSNELPSKQRKFEVYHTPLLCLATSCSSKARIDSYIKMRNRRRDAQAELVDKGK